MSSFAPAVGANIGYNGYIGQIRFVCEDYLTFCIRKKDSTMIGDVCLCIYKKYWDDIQLLKSSHS